MRLTPRQTLRVMLVGAVVLAVGSGSTEWFRERTSRLDADARSQELLVINDSTTARAARLRGERDSLAALFRAAKEMRGTLVAGVRILVKGDTIFRTDTTTITQIFPDSTRTATRTDSVNGYGVTITATAPPFPQDLRLGYELRTPKFEPEVGIVQRKDGYYAVVSWGGQKAQTGYAFYTPPKQRRIHAMVGSQVWISPNVLRPFGADIYAGLRLRQQQWEGSAVVGQRAAPYVGVGIARIF